MLFSERTTPSRVLVVDDSSLVRMWLQAGLRRLGFAVVDTAADGREALEKLHADRPDLVLTDYDMPGMSGAGLISSVREDSDLKDLPVVVVTGLASSACDWKALGFSQYLGKPFSLTRLETTIRNLLFGRPARQSGGFSWRVSGHHARERAIAV